MRNVFKDIDLTEGLEKAKEHYFRVAIEGYYGWGTGYYSERLARKWEQEVLEELKGKAEDIGYRFVNAKDSMSCPELKSRHPACEKVDLYIHPMEITGIATPETISRIVDIVKATPYTQSAEITIDKGVYDVSDFEYQKILNKHATEILSCLKKGMEISAQTHEYFDAEFDFAKATRIPRIQNRTEGVLSSSDVDVMWVKNLKDIGKELHLFDNKIFEMIDRVTTIEKDTLDGLEEDLEDDLER